MWGLARIEGGRVLLRIEDHDRQRSRAEFERAIREDLAWLGFVADEDTGRQSDRSSNYETALARLRAQRVVYACNCSRADVERDLGFRLRSRRQRSELRRDAPKRISAKAVSRTSEIRYPGTCREKGLRESRGTGTRIRLDPSVEVFDDLLHGVQEQRPSEQCGDLLARDREGNWTYQFAVTVDDMIQHVTLVIRGDDLLSSTGRQIQLARLLGRDVPPRFLHHPLVMKSATQKLSKADRDTSVRDWRARGLSAAEVIGEAGRRAGLNESGRPIPAGDVAQLVADLRRSCA